MFEVQRDVVVVKVYLREIVLEVEGVLQKYQNEEKGSLFSEEGEIGVDDIGVKREVGGDFCYYCCCSFVDIIQIYQILFFDDVEVEGIFDSFIQCVEV